MARIINYTDESDMITTKEFAEAVGAPYPTVMRWVKGGKISGAQLVQESRGPVWYIPKKAVADFKKPERGRPVKAAPVQPEPKLVKKARGKGGKR